MEFIVLDTIADKYALINSAIKNYICILEKKQETDETKEKLRITRIDLLMFIADYIRRTYVAHDKTAMFRTLHITELKKATRLMAFKSDGTVNNIAFKQLFDRFLDCENKINEHKKWCETYGSKA